MLSIVTFPLQGYYFVFLPVNLTTDRFLLGLWMFIAMLCLMLSLRSRIIVPLVLVFPFVFTMFLSVLTGRLTGFIDMGRALMSIVAASFFVLSFHYASDVKLRYRFLRLTAYGEFLILLLFAIVVLTHQMRYGLPPESMPFVNSLPLIGARANRFVAQAGRGFGLGPIYRLTLPFGRPQDYGLLAGVALFSLWLTYTESASRRAGRIVRQGTIAIIVILIVLSGSRSVLFPLILGTSYVGFSRLFHSSKPFRRLTYNQAIGRLSRNALVVTMVAVVGFFATDRNLLRISSDTSTAGHLTRRFAVINEYVDGSVLQQIVGYGSKASVYLTGASSSHMTFLTALFEQGAIGLVAILVPYAYSLGMILSTPRRFQRNNGHDIQMGLLLFLFSANLLYEFSTFPAVWIGLGIVAGHSYDLKNQTVANAVASPSDSANRTAK